MTLEDLAAIGVVENNRQDEDDDDHHGSVEWRLAGDDGEIIAGVFNTFQATGGGVARNVGLYLHSSPYKRRRRAGNGTCYGGYTHTSCHL